MIRAALVAAVLIAVALAAAWFAENPGNVAIDWRGWRIETSLGAAALLTIAALVVFAVVHRLWLWLRTGPRRMGASRAEERRRQGYRALTRGLVAVAAGDAEESGRLAERAEALLKDPPLTLLLSAQAAQLKGDERAAERYFEAMLGNPELEFLGLRGLLRSALRLGQTDKALTYAKRAYRIRPTSEWIQGTLLELELGAGEWRQAETLLTDMSRRGAVKDEVARRRRAILMLEHAAVTDANGDRAAAAKLAVRAHEAAPGFVPAAVAAARMLGSTAKSRRAQKVLEDTWRLEPHPDLAAAVMAAWPGEQAPQQRRQLEQMVGGKLEHRETAIALARAAVVARDWAAARRHLEKATGPRPEVRVCRLWAEVEDGEFGPGLAAREWLMRAANAPADPAWVCANCGQTTPEWSPNCPHCMAFDALRWRGADAAAEVPMLPPGGVAAAAAALARPPTPAPAETPAAVVEVERIAPPLESRTAPPATGANDDAVPHVLTEMPLPPDVPALSPDDRTR